MIPHRPTETGYRRVGIGAAASPSEYMLSLIIGSRFTVFCLSHQQLSQPFLQPVTIRYRKRQRSTRGIPLPGGKQTRFILCKPVKTQYTSD